VSKDLDTIANSMLDWETKLVTLLELTDVDLHDLKKMHPDPRLLR
jgi:hypothetical protein